MYPLMEINLEHLKKNILTLKNISKKSDIDITGITKVFCGDFNIAKIFVDNGIKILGDSRIENLKKLKSLKAEKWLIRLPMMSEIEELLEYSDASLNSEIKIIEKINEIALKKNIVHKIILMVDLGDIREGYTDYKELLEVAKKIEKMKGVYLYGIGVNLTCFSYTEPTEEKMNELSFIAENIEKEIGRKLEVISGGNSSTINLLTASKINKKINNLRLGESILFGREVATYKKIENTYDDVFTLSCEIIELKEKPSLPWGKILKDEDENFPDFKDLGKRKRAICAIGKQDFDIKTTSPIENDLSFIGTSSDHLIIDVTDSQKKYEVGDIIKLKLGYLSTLRAFTSPYVKKIYKY